MPRVPLPGGGGAGTPVFLPHLGKGEGSATNNATGPGVKVPQALDGWHDLNRAVAGSLPTSLHNAGRVQRAVLSQLRARGRVR